MNNFCISYAGGIIKKQTDKQQQQQQNEQIKPQPNMQLNHFCLAVKSDCMKLHQLLMYTEY